MPRRFRAAHRIGRRLGGVLQSLRIGLPIGLPRTLEPTVLPDQAESMAWVVDRVEPPAPIVEAEVREAVLDEVILPEVDDPVDRPASHDLTLR
jgi:hypothetical protein